MKRLSVAISLVVLLGGLAYGASSYKGYLVDVMCSGRGVEKVKTHSKACALSPSCAGSGFAIVTEDGKVYKLDESGNKKAAEVYKSTKSDNGLPVTVEGELDGEMLKVTKITEDKK